MSLERGVKMLAHFTPLSSAIVAANTQIFVEQNGSKMNSSSHPVVSNLYKYGPGNLDRLEPILTRNDLYFPSPNQLNDPAEAKPRLAKLPLERILSSLYDMFLVNNPGLPPERYELAKAQIKHNGVRFGSHVLLREMSKSLNTELETLRIYSMAKRADNMALWAKYADDHKGYCLEFSNSGLFAAAQPVSYGDIVDLDPTDPQQITAYFLFQKTLDWQSEEEVRLVAPRGSEAIVGFDPNLLTRIIVGQCMLDRKVDVIQKWANLRSPKLAIIRAEYNEFEHKLNFIPVLE